MGIKVRVLPMGERHLSNTPEETISPPAPWRQSSRADWEAPLYGSTESSPVSELQRLNL